MKYNLYRKLTSTFLRKWWLLAVIALCILLIAIAFTICFDAIFKAIINSEISLRKDTKTYNWWAKPPVMPVISIYIYNVTNADEFLSNGSKPQLDEIGPYVYTETWERKNVVFHDNGTISFNQERIYTFDAERSVGSEDDMVVVPNIPMLSATSQSKYSARFLRLAMASILDVLKVKPFVEVTVGQLLWGYEDPLLKLAKEVISQDQKLPYEEFGLMYNKNGTSKDTTTIFSGTTDITKYGLIDKFNGNSSLSYWKTSLCNRLNGSDGSIFPPHITKDTTLYVYDKDLCRLLPLVFDKEVMASGGVTAYRFTPPKNVFANPEISPENDCFCPHGPPCTPSGLLNVSLCQFDSPIVLSFPHFYLASDSLRDDVEGISEPNPEKHKFEVDVHPEMGTTMRARARMQINLAVTQVEDIKQVATFPDIIFPIMWFEEGIDGLPEEVTSLMRLAATAKPLVYSIVSFLLFFIGAIAFMLSSWKLIRGANRNQTLPLSTPTSFYMMNHKTTKMKDISSK